MIPILYDENEQSFTTNGIGRMVDAVSGYVEEERNGIYEMQMTYPIDGQLYDELKLSRYLMVKPADGKDPQPFRIYEISKPMGGIVTVKGEHISYQLTNIPVMPFEAVGVGAALAGLKTNAAEACPFSFSTDKTDATTKYVQTIPASMRSRLFGEQGSILQLFKGEYEFDRYNVKLWSRRGSNNGVTLRYGKNITDLRQEESIREVYTGICPFWKGEENGTQVVVTLPEKVIHTISALDYPYKRTITVDFSSEFDTKPTVSQLRTRAQSFISDNSIGIPKVNLKVSFAALWQTEEYKKLAYLERVNLCDTVKVEFEKLGVSASSKVVRTKFDYLNEKYIEIELGQTQSKISDIVAAQEIEKAQEEEQVLSWFKKAIKGSGDVVKTGYGGHIVWHNSTGGWPDEMIIMDTDDPSTAQKVWRFNLGGIACSTNGYNGDFNAAWTIDGNFDAEVINVINLNASNIKSGTLTSLAINNGKGTFSVDANGNLVAKSADIQGGSINIVAGSDTDSRINLSYGDKDSGYAYNITNWSPSSFVVEAGQGANYYRATHDSSGFIAENSQNGHGYRCSVSPNDVSMYYDNTVKGTINISDSRSSLELKNTEAKANFSTPSGGGLYIDTSSSRGRIYGAYNGSVRFQLQSYSSYTDFRLVYGSQENVVIQGNATAGFINLYKSNKLRAQLNDSALVFYDDSGNVTKAYGNT